MKVLVTGNMGLVGQVVVQNLRGRNIETVGFDLEEGKDILDIASLIKAGETCDAVIHSAALMDGTAEELTRTNLLGTWHVLESARINKLKKVIFLSSVDVLGIFKGEGVPEYFPIDDQHICKPISPYGISKKLSEEMCQSFTQINNIPTICLRPPGVWRQETYVQIAEARRLNPKFEWNPYWEYGAFIDLRDLADLIINCLETEYIGHGCYLATSDDLSSSGMTAREWVNKLHPEVRWKKLADFEQKPYRSLLDCRETKATFNWQPQFSWVKFMEETVSEV